MCYQREKETIGKKKLRTEYLHILFRDEKNCILQIAQRPTFVVSFYISYNYFQAKISIIDNALAN